MPSTRYHCVFVKKFDGGDFLILLLYMNDMLIVKQDIKKIASLKKALGKAFAMKGMGPLKQSLIMHIVRDRTKKLLQRFNMQDSKPVGSALPTNCKLNTNQCLKTKVEKAEMNKIPYALAITSLIYTMVCSRPVIVYIGGVVN